MSAPSPRQRPAETTASAASALGAIIVLAFHLGPSWSAPLTVLVGHVPAAMTWVVNFRRNAAASAGPGAQATAAVA